MNIKRLTSLFLSNKKYILSSICLYFIFLISSIPANTVVSLINLPSVIKISSISGTIWSGRIENISVSNIKIGSLAWNVHPLKLLLAELSMDVSIVKNKQFVTSKVILSSTGKINLEKTQFFVNLSLFQPLTYGMPFSYTGIAEGTFPSVLLDKNNDIGINGRLTLTDLTLVSPQRQLFGDFTVDFKPNGKSDTTAKVKDIAGPLKVDGILTLSKDGKVNLHAELAALEKASP